MKAGYSDSVTDLLGGALPRMTLNVHRRDGATPSGSDRLQSTVSRTADWTIVSNLDVRKSRPFSLGFPRSLPRPLQPSPGVTHNGGGLRKRAYKRRRVQHCSMGGSRLMKGGIVTSFRVSGYKLHSAECHSRAFTSGVAACV